MGFKLKWLKWDRSIQSIYDHQQSTKETVDEYAQELKKLFAKAYVGMVHGSPEAESIAQLVLANQFIFSLRSEWKAKVVGTEGKLEQVLFKARFEEAKKRELTTATSTPHQKKIVDSGDSSLSSGSRNHPKGNPPSSSVEKQTRAAKLLQLWNGRPHDACLPISQATKK